MDQGPAVTWARKIFNDLTEPLAREIPRCLVRAHQRAKHGHQGVGTQTLEAYGHGLYAAQYEELTAGLENLPEAAPARLQGRTVMIVAGYLLYPLRYAKKDVPVTEAHLRRATGFRADLIRRHGPEPVQAELDLGLDELREAEVHRDLLRISPDTRLVLLAYACSMERGVVRVEWGDAELRHDDKHLLWHHHEPLPMPADGEPN
ncbi:hypothetical protein SAMN06297387_10698 [Streptomyces zhaozhouensis]|uniref:Uncharacterized protein n=1 Tax=Streptomyces zhaozhouensis TaxID=1300267 RepID=A0A286DV22_9ACTN|nr:hypothetical protein SAMN06297387_10698 [Streptomyces zhaozhouensis]